MEFFKNLTQIRFMEKKHLAFAFSIILCTVCLGVVYQKGLHLGLDFTGGTQIEMHFKSPVNPVAIRTKLTQANFHHPVVQAYGSSRAVLIRLTPHSTQFSNKQLKQKLTTFIQKGTIARIEYIGPQVGKTMLTNGIIAILLSVIITMIYIALRFEYRFAISAALSLVHDPIVILGAFSFFQLEFDLIALAALLTILGYSLNDTIVVYDRIRENFNLNRKMPTDKVVDLSINQTLSRTIMTSGLTLLVVIALCLLGGATLQGFSIALIIGIVVGTYSSIYVAGALAVVMGLHRDALLPAKAKVGTPEDLMP